MAVIVAFGSYNEVKAWSLYGLMDRILVQISPFFDVAISRDPPAKFIQWHDGSWYKTIGNDNSALKVRHHSHHHHMYPRSKLTRLHQKASTNVKSGGGSYNPFSSRIESFSKQSYSSLPSDRNDWIRHAIPNHNISNKSVLQNQQSTWSRSWISKADGR